MNRNAIWRAACLSTLAAVAVLTHPVIANAVVVRGSVRDPLGRPIASARVQLVKGKQVVGSAITLTDGSYEIRSADEGRFLLLAVAPTFAVQVSQPFYGRPLDVVSQNLALTISPVRQEVTVTATGLPTPVQQINSSVTTVQDQALATRVDIAQELRLQPGVSIVPSGQNGSLTSMFVRGAESNANKVLVDEVPANDIGGVFDFGPFASTAVRALETHRGPDSVLYGTDARAGVIRLETPRGTSIRPVLTYSGDAGNYHTYRDEATLSGTYGKADYYTAFSRFDSSNALPNDRFHAMTEAMNVGYNFTANTSVRGTVRNGDSAVGLPGPFNFQGLTQLGKQGDQDTYISGVIDDTRRSRWQNTFRYIGARKREQAQQFASVGTPDGFGDYFGKFVTIVGANGTFASGQAIVGYDPFPTKYELVSNRDGVDYRSTYRVNDQFAVTGGFRFQNERGSYVYPVFDTNQQITRANYDYTLQMQGSFHHRLFYTLGGAIQRNSLYGTQGEPQLGIGYYVIRPGRGWFEGTHLRANFSKGVQEPSLSTELSSLYVALQGLNDTADIANFHVRPIDAQRSRSYEGGVDQNIYTDSVVLKLSYFHNTYDRGIEYVTTSQFNGYFHQNLPPALYGFYLNSLATRSEGIEAELQWQLMPRLFFRGGYTYLDSTVLQSFSSDALNALGGTPTINPRYPGVPIGVSSPLVGARPFRRAPHTGFATLSYAGVKWNAALEYAMATKSDDSTFIDQYSNANFDNSMLLPNRNLAYGYNKLDAHVTYQWKPSFAVFVQGDNLTNEKNIGAFGYPSLPITFRAGLKVRFPAE